VAEVTIVVDVDTDRDGFPDGLERLYGYDPLLADSDGDGIDDGFEDRDGDGRVAEDETDPRDADTDDDGLLDGEETWAASPPGLTDPRVPDTDADGLLDGAERALGAEPTDADTDDDGLLDGAEVQQGTRPDDPDTDDDGRCDGERVDNEGNGTFEPESLCVGTELQSGIYFVHPGGDDSIPLTAGLSWGTAFRTVQGALDAAGPGESIWIAHGTYRGRAAREPVARPRPGQRLLGGFEGDERTLDERPQPPVGTVFNGDRFADGRTIDDAERLVVAASGVVLDGLQLVNGYRTARDGEGGAGLWLDDVDDVRVVDVSFNVGFAHFGGAVGCIASSARFDRVVFRRNIAAGAGGAVHALAGCTLTFTDARFDDNDAVLDGGGIALEAASTVDIARAVFARGKADFNGGALALADESVAVVDEARFARNQAEFSGGAVFVDSESSLTVSRSRFFANRSEDGGGAIGAQDLGRVDVDTSVFSSNRAGGQGGAVRAFDFAEASLGGVLFTGNSALAEGGAVAAVENVLVTLDDAHLDQNRGDRGGALYVESDAVLRMRNGLLTRNEASEGGGLVVSLAEVELSHASARANIADVGGVAVVEEAKLSIHNSVFSGNVGRDEGADLAGDDLSDVEVTGHCGADDLDQPDLGWTSDGAVVLDDDPFQALASGQALLVAGAACRGVGDVDVADEVFTSLGRDWALGSATTDRTADGADGRADPGWHATPGSPLIKRYLVEAGGIVEFTVEGAGECAFLDGEELIVATLDAATRAAEIVRLERPARSRLTLECLDGVGVTRASALVP
jgi:predicted outer membrane repeat protein